VEIFWVDYIYMEVDGISSIILYHLLFIFIEKEKWEKYDEKG
jgi:hypothetical protein